MFMAGFPSLRDTSFGNSEPFFLGVWGSLAMFDGLRSRYEPESEHVFGAP